MEEIHDPKLKTGVTEADPGQEAEGGGARAGDGLNRDKENQCGFDVFFY
jgi:hypothetical protein